MTTSFSEAFITDAHNAYFDQGQAIMQLELIGQSQEQVRDALRKALIANRLPMLAGFQRPLQNRYVALTR